MPKFIELTFDGSDEKIMINVDKIISITRRPGMKYTVLDLESAQRGITVKETPNEIVGRAQG
jgi:hypothetical protein